MSNVQKNLEISDYLSLYGALLTEHQSEMLRLYYDCDISLFEIAEQFSISRQAVRDAIVRGEKLLLEYESKLRLKKSNQALKEKILVAIELIRANKNAESVLQSIISEMEE
ncbi:MAG: sigma factor-like helix-turn-helix DNA-binding protein [Clostridia bacterium]